MKIELNMIPVRNVVAGYKDDAEEGVYGYNGKLNIRPKYQREFIYKEKQRDAVITTVMSGFPLNSMYWMKNTDGSFEVLDGQQRTISICQYVNNDFSLNYRFFFNLTKEEQEQILDYELMVYICEGTDKERLEWFKTINIAGEKLYDQELRNAVYTGTWLTDAKKYFSKTGCPASDMGSKYLKGSAIRQEYLETVLDWISSNEGISIEQYMAIHQNDATAVSLWNYFNAVLSWVKAIFPVYRSEMKGLPWGIFYNKYHNDNLDPRILEATIQKLMGDDDITKKSGIYEYLLSGIEKVLSIRSFDRRDKLAAYERQGHKCAICGKTFKFEDMHGDHIVPWSKGGRTIPENCQMLCTTCNIKKSSN